MRTDNIHSYENGKDIPIIPSDLEILSILFGSNYPCLELIFMVPKVFEPLKFDLYTKALSYHSSKYVTAILIFLVKHNIQT